MSFFAAKAAARLDRFGHLQAVTLRDIPFAFSAVGKGLYLFRVQNITQRLEVFAAHEITGHAVLFHRIGDLQRFGFFEVVVEVVQVLCAELVQ